MARKNLRQVLVKIVERGLSIGAFIFSFMESCYYFGQQTFMTSDVPVLNNFYINHIDKFGVIYGKNLLIIFGVMIGIFNICSRGMLPLSKFARFNIIQAILVNILCSVGGQIYVALPLIIRQSTLGTIICTGSFFLVVLTIFYCSFLVLLGKYPVIPIVTDAAFLQVQRHRRP